jgi:hypothetical protein
VFELIIALAAVVPQHDRRRKESRRHRRRHGFCHISRPAQRASQRKKDFFELSRSRCNERQRREDIFESAWTKKVMKQYKKFRPVHVVYNEKAKNRSQRGQKNGKVDATKPDSPGHQLAAAVHVIASVLASSSLINTARSQKKNWYRTCTYVAQKSR